MNSPTCHTACGRVAPSRPRLIRRRGFSLIEMMAAMAVLSILMLVLLRVFGNSTNAFTVGTSKSQQVADARLALDLIAAEMQNAAINIVTPNDQSSTLDLSPQAGGQRVRYEVVTLTDEENSGTGYDTKYTRKALQKITAGGTSYVYIDNLLRFEVVPFEAAPIIPAKPAIAGMVVVPGDFTGFNPASGVAKTMDSQPPLVSIFIETLSEQDQIRASRISNPASRTKFEDRRTRRFTRSVLFRRTQAERF